MGKFRKLTLEESKQQFELINDETQRALKGGGGNNGPTLLNEENSPNGLYSFNFLEEIQENDQYPISPMSGDGSIWLDEVYVYGYYPHGNTPDYGVYCMTHHYYFPANRECYECQYSNDGGSYGYSNYYGSTYAYYGDYYGNYYGSQYAGHYGGGTSGGGSNSSGGSGTTDSRPSGVNFKVSSDVQIGGTCVIECILQTLITYGDTNLKIDEVLTKIAEIEFNNPRMAQILKNNNINTIGGVKSLLAFKGIPPEDIQYILNQMFNTKKIEGSSKYEDIDIATNQGNAVFGWITYENKEKHAVMITDIDGETCTYYDPMEPTVVVNNKKKPNFKKMNVKDFTELIELEKAGKKNKN